MRNSGKRHAADRKDCLYQEIQEAIRKESLKEWKTRHGLDAVVGLKPNTADLRNHIANGRIRTKDGEIIRVEWFKHGFYFEVDDNRISASYESVSSNTNKREREVAEELLPEVNHVKDVIDDLYIIATEKRAKFEMK